VDRSPRPLPSGSACGGGLTKHLTIEDVRTMAFDKGILALKEIGLDHGIWKVQRRDASGRKIEMRVDAASGEIVKMRRNN